MKDGKELKELEEQTELHERTNLLLIINTVATVGAFVMLLIDYLND